MNEPNGPDPLDRLRAADPMRADDVPSASLARVSARVQEHIMTDTPKPTSAASSRRPLALIGAVGLVGALALAVALSGGLGPKSPSPVAVVPSATPAPTVAPSDEPIVDPAAGPNTGGGGLASCIRYDTSILQTMEIAFDGTVTKVDGDQVTFDVNKGWKGATGSIMLTDPTTGSSVALLGPLPDFKVGGRYLVTAAGSNINSCGYTLDYDADTAASWAAAFGG